MKLFTAALLISSVAAWTPLTPPNAGTYYIIEVEVRVLSRDLLSNIIMMT